MNTTELQKEITRNFKAAVQSGERENDRFELYDFIAGQYGRDVADANLKACREALGI